MSDDNKPIFIECMKCGERWKIGTTPMAIHELGIRTRHAACPNCNERREIVMLPTKGDGAVTAARDGKKVTR